MYSDFMNIINDIESGFPVSTWKINNIHIWPIFRFNLFFLNASLRTSKKRSRSQNKTLSQKKNLFIENLSGVIQDIQAHQLDISHNDDFLDVDFLFLSQTTNRNSKIESYWYDRICDPYITILNELNISSLLLECSPSHQYRVPRYSQSIFIQDKINSCKFKSKLSKKNKIAEKISGLDGFSLFKDYIESKGLKNFPKDRNLAYQIISIQNMSTYFLGILKHINPKAGFSVPYYWDIAMAFNLACYKIGIQSIDIQHGIQSDSHVAYSRWNAVPTDGYELLPSYFLCWSDSEVKLINKWRDRITQNHQPIAIGNLTLEIWLNENIKAFKDVSSKISDLFQADTNLVEPTINILFTLQPINDPLPVWVIEAIQASPKPWKWWMRLHPAMLSQEKFIEQILHQNTIDNVNLQSASELPLPALLAHMDVHVTQLSSVVLEAEFFNVPSVITDSRAVQLFPEQIESNMALLATNSQELIETISQQFSRSKKNLTSLYKDKESSIEKAKRILIDIKKDP
ncbi:MAG: hypothetical protein AAF572_06415 [Cyanobacteria bacterium P01_B01_bin.77]